MRRADEALIYTTYTIPLSIWRRLEKERKRQSKTRTALVVEALRAWIAQMDSENEQQTPN